MRIAISGKLGSGKNTAATLIQELLPQYEWKELAFAYRLKEVVATWTGTTIEQNLSREGKKFIPPGSQFTLAEWQQKVGMMGREYLGSNIWIDLVLANLKPEDYVIVTDCRFKNEANQLKQKGFVLIRIEGDPTGLRKKRKVESEPTSSTSYVIQEFEKESNSVMTKVVKNEDNIAADGRDMSHPSEVDLDDYPYFDVIIHNTGTIDDLRKQLASFLSDIM